jgi:hypothetical protein
MGEGEGEGEEGGPNVQGQFAGEEGRLDHTKEM